MKRNIRYSILSFAATIAVVALVGCQRDDLAVDTLSDDILNFSVGFAGRGELTVTKGTSLTSEDGSVSIPLSCVVTNGIMNNLPDAAVASESASATKGTQINSEAEFLSEGLTSFTAAGWNSDKSAFVPASTTVTYSDGQWQADGTYRWSSTNVKTFLACANLPSSGASVTNSVDPAVKQTFTCTVPTDAREQNDIMLGWYEGNGGGTATAAITMVHPLTAVVFKKGDMDASVSAIKSISIAGVYTDGTADVTYSLSGSDVVPAYNWSDSRTGSQTVTLGPAEGASELEVSADGKIGTSFIVLPQTIGEGALTVNITIVKDGTDAVLSATVPAGQWQEGKTNTYTIGYEVPTYTFTFTLEGGETSRSQSFSNTTSAKSVSIPLTSTKAKGAEVTPADWIIKSVQVGSGEVQTIGTSSFDNIGGLSARQTASGTLSITAAARTGFDPGSHSYWVNNSKRTDKLDWSPVDWSSSYARTTYPVDLSKFDFQTDETHHHQMTTANCYIIRHAGTYKLPLVYGNAVMGGVENTDAYAPKMAADGVAKYFLSPFLNYLGGGITSAFIENNADCGGSDLKCAVVWQDKAAVVKDVEIVGTLKSIGTYDASNVRYLQFTVNNSSICQNNALICVYKDTNGNGIYDSGEAIWSWHIWITNNPALRTNPISVTNATNVEYKFFPIYNLGWIDAAIYPSREDVKIVLMQEKSENDITITVQQDEARGQSNGCWYQFGRKDPMCTTSTPAQGKFTKNGGIGTTIDGSIRNPGKFFTSNYNDWCTTAYYNLWTGKKCTAGEFDQANDMIKTVYDPSPVGYKIPASNAFTSFSNGGSKPYNVTGKFEWGWHFYTKPQKQGDTIFFSTSGQLNQLDGSIEQRSAGRYWSAFHESESKSYSFIFDDGSGGLGVRFPAFSAYGFSIRPVSY